MRSVNTALQELANHFEYMVAWLPSRSNKYGYYSWTLMSIIIYIFMLVNNWNCLQKRLDGAAPASNFTKQSKSHLHMHVYLRAE